MQLKDLIPQKAQFSLRSTGREHTLRPFSLSDTAWLHSKFSDEEIARIFEKLDTVAISQIVYHQLVDEDKRQFLAQEMTHINDEGEEEKIRYSGPQIFMQAIQGMDEELAMAQALMECRGMSLPLMEEMQKESAKKKELPVS
jgi:hypothetical protein